MSRTISLLLKMFQTKTFKLFIAMIQNVFQISPCFDQSLYLVVGISAKQVCQHLASRIRYSHSATQSKLTQSFEDVFHFFWSPVPRPLSQIGLYMIYHLFIQCNTGLPFRLPIFKWFVHSYKTSTEHHRSFDFETTI